MGVTLSVYPLYTGVCDMSDLRFDSSESMSAFEEYYLSDTESEDGVTTIPVSDIVPDGDTEATESDGEVTEASYDPREDGEIAHPYVVPDEATEGEITEASAVSECDGCGEEISEHYARVLGDNNDRVDACLSCASLRERRESQ